MSTKFVANGFSTVLPDGWADRSMVTLVNLNAASGFATNVVVLREEIAANTSVVEYARTQISQVQTQIPSFRVLDERPTTVQDLPAYQTLQRFTSNERHLQQAQTFILKGQTIFAVTCTALLEESDAAMPAFREILNNLSFD